MSKEGIRSALFAWVLAAVAAALIAGVSSADTLEAQLAFTVPTDSTPWSLSYDEGRDEWAVLYRDAGLVRFFSPDGTLLRTHTPNVSILRGFGVYDQATVVDITSGGPDSNYWALMGNPDASLPPEPWMVTMYRLDIEVPHYDPFTPDSYYPGSGVLNLRAPLQMARYEMLFDEQGGCHSGVEVGLGHLGTKLYLWDHLTKLDGSASVVLSLPDHGIPEAQSATFRASDLSPVVLHDNQLSVLQRYMVFERSAGTPYVWDIVSYSAEEDIGNLLVHYDITGLPVGVQLIDVYQVRAILQPHPENDVYYVLDQVGGGVYELVPEPGSAVLLGTAMAALVARRRRRR